ncbi:CbtB-domain containing protein [Sulfitobacter albidus]|uniref:CbtB-domain containing protein n=1 Tax=Sulfitobacter albidus TaxID=2829501 RepID=A0A975PME3_9RHOB|nr:CbtB domain-containing protein [Sulfitobacter albidus]QUJ76326.1 CbtB-domain containing protein [Sulfitobacter albidus]
MKTEAQTVAATRSATLPALFAVILGVAVITMTGHLQAATLHDAAHDMRHATGFPCH